MFAFIYLYYYYTLIAICTGVNTAGNIQPNSRILKYIWHSLRILNIAAEYSAAEKYLFYYSLGSLKIINIFGSTAENNNIVSKNSL